METMLWVCGGGRGRYAKKWFGDSEAHAPVHANSVHSSDELGTKLQKGFFDRGITKWKLGHGKVETGEPSDPY
jgi:hypothetical protein